MYLSVRHHILRHIGNFLDVTSIYNMFLILLLHENQGIPQDFHKFTINYNLATIGVQSTQRNGVSNTSFKLITC